VSNGEIQRNLASISALFTRSKRLVLLWGMRPATIAVNTTGGGSVLATYDGDTTQMLMQSLVGTPLRAGDRVMVMAVPPAANYVLGKLDGRTSSYRYLQAVYYPATGSFVKADYVGLTAIRVRVIGGGGGGGGAAAAGGANVSVAGGGGGGGYSERFIVESALAATETVTIGAGGAGGVAGNNAGSTGGASSLGTLAVGNGGVGGAGSGAAGGGAVSGVGGAGGTGTTGDLNIQGADGLNGIRGVGVITQQGLGGAVPGFSGGSTRGTNTVAGNNGTAGRLYGGGGSGGYDTTGATARSGGAGANGIVIVDVYVA
jgi:hypothetical protein